MKPPVKIICPQCDGSGMVRLSELLMDTLYVVRQRPGCDAKEVKLCLDTTNDFHVTAFNNRLETLKELGLLTRKKCGKAWKYWPVTKAKKK